jgi:glycosyltransferase involved in cell wall biosynthesis
MKKIKILIWAPFISKVGTVNNVINSAYSLQKFSKKKIFEILLINSTGEWKSYKDELCDKGLNLVDFFNLKAFNKFKKEGFIKSRLAYMFIFLVSFFPLFKYLKKEKPDFLNIYLVTSLPLILFSLFNFKTKLILNVAGHPKINFFRKYLWKKCSDKISYIICPSNELKKKFLELNLFSVEKLLVIQDPHINARKINKLKRIKFDDNFFDKNKVLISVGRLTKQKNYFFLIVAFKKLIKKYANLKLLIIGDGEEKQSLNNLIKKFSLNDKIKITGYKENIYNYLSRSDFYVSTSSWEGSSLSMIDSAFIGLPILCSDCPTGRKEFIEDNKRGYIFQNNNELDFLEKFDQMFNEPPKKIRSKLLEAKKEIKKFTLYSHYRNLSNIF